jgi:hypothetical protein
MSNPMSGNADASSQVSLHVQAVPMQYKANGSPLDGSLWGTLISLVDYNPDTSLSTERSYAILTRENAKLATASFSYAWSSRASGTIASIANQLIAWKELRAVLLKLLGMSPSGAQRVLESLCEQQNLIKRELFQQMQAADLESEDPE